jgi:hypothetical protein
LVGRGALSGSTSGSASAYGFFTQSGTISGSTRGTATVYGRLHRLAVGNVFILELTNSIDRDLPITVSIERTASLDASISRSLSFSSKVVK